MRWGTTSVAAAAGRGGIGIRLCQASSWSIQVNTMFDQKMVANTAHVLANIGTQLAYFATIALTGQATQVLCLEVGIHGNVTLKSLFAYGALKAQLRLELFLSCGCGHFVVEGPGGGGSLFGVRGLRGCDSLVTKLH